jgi:8-oxo-dGTP diphosphatase
MARRYTIRRSAHRACSPRVLRDLLRAVSIQLNGVPAPVLVAAGVIVREGRVLLSQRKRGAHLEGAWEFPGGKVEPGEDPRAALARELAEELGVDADVGAPVEVTFHRYPGKDVLLLFFEASLREGSPEPRALDVADVRWAAAGDLRDELFPPADVAVLVRVRARLVTAR